MWLCAGANIASPCRQKRKGLYRPLQGYNEPSGLEAPTTWVPAPGPLRVGDGRPRVGERKWASQGWDEKGGCQGCAKKRVLKAHAGRKMLPRLAQLTQGMANLAISWVVMRFRWAEQRIGGLNKASFTRAQPAPNHFEAHKNGAKRASQQLACLAPATTAAGTEPSEASRPRRGRFALQRNPEGGVPLHCNRLRL